MVFGPTFNHKSMTRIDYKPLVDRIRSWFLAWYSKSISYAWRFQLINSVFASIINFWRSPFRLPKRCFEAIERMCIAFLWSGSPHTSTKAKVVWEDLCAPKREGGLRVWRMQDVSYVFSLKLIWRIRLVVGLIDEMLSSSRLILLEHLDENH